MPALGQECAPDSAVSGGTADAMAEETRAWEKLTGSGAALATDAASVALLRADQARVFYNRFPASERVREARKLEAICLINAVVEGKAGEEERMRRTVAAFRADGAIPGWDRAVVAGTYEFNEARTRIKSAEDMAREFEAVARGLMREFPDQPQGYTSLLTQAMMREPGEGRRMIQEVLDAPAPEEPRLRARRLATRLDLIGEPLMNHLDGFSAGGRPSVIYFWSAASPDSLALAARLAPLDAAKVNLIGICIDADPVAAARAATGLPGRLLYPAETKQGDQLDRIGADEAPALYLVDAAGNVTDVRGLTNLDEKLGSLGL